MLNRYFADHFVQLARQNTHTFGDYETTQQEIIANWRQIVTTGYYGEVYPFSSTGEDCV